MNFNVNKLFRVLSIVLFIGFFIIFSSVVFLEISPFYLVPMRGKILLSAVMVVLLLTSSVMHTHIQPTLKEKYKTMGRATWILFIVYIFYLTLMLFFDVYFGRLIFAFNGSYSEYITTKINLIPFHTIGEYWQRMQHGLYDISWVNVLGNIVAFAPMGVFIPVLLPKFRVFHRYLLLMLVVITCLELMQLLLMVGICDIDDLILNTFGAMLMFWTLKLKIVQKILVRLYLIKTPTQTY